MKEYLTEITSVDIIHTSVSMILGLLPSIYTVKHGTQLQIPSQQDNTFLKIFYLW